VALGSEWLDSWIDLSDADAAQSIFRASLVAYYLLGWGFFNCMLVVTLARPLLALSVVALATLTLLIVGLPLSLALHFTYAPIAFSVGAGCFVVASTWGARRVLRAADYHYAASF